MIDVLIVVPLTPAIAESTGFPLVNSGMLVSAYPIASAVSAFFSAPFSDKLGRKKMLLIFSIGFCLSSIGCAVSTHSVSIFGFRILSGIFGGPVLSNSLAFASDTFRGPIRAKALTTIMLSFSVASIMGVPVGAWIGDHFTWNTAFWAITIGSVCCIFFILKMKNIETGAEQGLIGQQYREMLSLLKISRVRRVFLLQFVMSIGLFGFVPNIGPWLSVNMGMSSTQIGLVYMQGGVGGFIGNILSGKLLQRGIMTQLMVVGSIIMGIFLFITTQEYLPPAYYGVLFAGIMFGGTLRMPALQLLFTYLVPIHMRGRLMSTSIIVANITMGMGGVWCIPLLTIEAERVSGMGTIGIIATLMLAMVPILIFLLKKEIDQVVIDKH